MWLKIAEFVAPVLVIGLLALWLNNIAYDHGTAAANLICTQKTVPEALAAAKTVCDTSIEQSQETCHEAATQLATANANRDRLRNEHAASAKCTVTASGRSAGGDGTGKAAVPTVRVGATIEWFDDAFQSADINSGYLTVCQDTLRGIYTAAGQQDRLGLDPTQASPAN